MRRKRSLPCLLCFAAAVLFLAAGFAQGKRAEDFRGSVTLCFAEEVAAETVEAIRSDEDLSYTFAAWREDREQRISAAESGRSATADVIAVNGPSCALLPYGRTLWEDGKGGCLISMDLAEELYGSRRVEGQTLCNGDEILTVRGLITGVESLLIYETGAAEGFDRISIRVSEKENAVLAGRDFILRYGLDAQPLRLDLIGGVSWMEELIPGEWSDFDGWRQNWQEKKRELRFAAAAKKSRLESEYLNHIRMRNICMALGAICLGMGIAWQIVPSARTD